jgi:uncharacterized protein YprB with RNaseH-like and TPR domain
MNTHRCKHGHTYLEHDSCYLEEIDSNRKVGFFDIETSNLKADFGIVICWYILDNLGKYHGRVVTKEELFGEQYPDKNLMVELIDCLNDFDIIYTYYGTRFDIPFVRSRSVMMGLDFPPSGALKHKDIYYIIKNKFALHRKSQEVAAEMLLGETSKTHWSAKHWVKAIQGNAESLKYISDHCKIDCLELKKISEKVLDFSKPVEATI